MTLHDLFLWLKDDERVPNPLVPLMITKGDIEAEMASALMRRRELRADLYTRRIQGVSPSAEGGQGLMAHQDEYIHFIEFLSSMPDTTTPLNPFVVAIEYLLYRSASRADSETLEERIEPIFYQFLTESPIDAQDLFLKHQDDFEKRPAIKMMISVEKTTQALEKFMRELSHQEDILSITPLFAGYFDDTETFAAAILSLLHRSVPVDLIFKTGLLQNFMLYHAAWLDDPDSQVTKLYRLLNHFPEAGELVLSAGGVQANDRSFHYEDEYKCLKMSSDPELLLFPQIDRLFKGQDGCIKYEDVLFEVKQSEQKIVRIDSSGEDYIALNRRIVALPLDKINTLSSEEAALFNKVTQRPIRRVFSRAISGGMSDQSLLRCIEKDDFPIEFTPTEENFGHLNALFGGNFLILALQWLVGKEASEWHSSLAYAMNQETLIRTELSSIINYIAVHESPTVLKLTASLITDETIESLLGSRSGAVLHLLKYKPLLRTRMSEGDIAHYLEQIKASDERVLDTIPQLLSLFKSFDYVNKGVAVLVYEAILDLLMEHTEFGEDEHLIGELRKLPDLEEVIGRRCLKLAVELEQCVTEKIASGQLDRDTYIDVLDQWTKTSRRLQVINEISPVKGMIPQDKYQLQAYLAKVYCTMHADGFDFFEYVHALQITPELLDDSVSEYERLLIELITTVDDDALRAVIIAIFDVNEAKRDSWMHTAYSDGCAFERAVKKGNVGFLRWLEPHVPLNPVLVEDSIKAAVDNSQWGVVDYLCRLTPYRPPQSFLKDLLLKASNAGQFSTVQLLCEGTITHLDSNAIEEVLARAAIGGHLQIVQYCCGLEYCHSKPTMLSRALKEAIRRERCEIIDYIGNLPKNSQLSLTIERELVNSAVQGKSHLVQRICSLTENRPPLAAIEEAFVKAIKNGHTEVAKHLYSGGDTLRPKAIDSALGSAMLQELSVVKFMCTLPGMKPSQEAIEKALMDAVKSKKLDRVQYFCTLDDPVVRKAAIEKALLQSVRDRQLDMVHFICTLGTVLPTKLAVKQAIQAATKYGCLPIVESLLPLAEQPLLEQTLQFAAEHGHLAIVQFCCGAYAQPNAKVIKEAIKKASLHSREDIVKYLSDYLIAVAHRAPPLSKARGFSKKEVAGVARLFSDKDSDESAAIVPHADKLPPRAAPLRRVESHESMVAHQAGVSAESALEARLPTAVKRSKSSGALSRLGLFHQVQATPVQDPALESVLGAPPV